VGIAGPQAVRGVPEVNSISSAYVPDVYVISDSLELLFLRNSIDDVGGGRSLEVVVTA